LFTEPVCYQHLNVEVPVEQIYLKYLAKYLIYMDIFVVNKY